ncbi:hypothetical protein AA313_de0207195 [Arthrobotrys entomopaga]|nr:hypothetical protein AA313_de0207195 [Arthrobotrys entomopaga]
MFEVNLFTPAQFGAFIPWLMLHRGPLSVLVHPNTGHELHDHTVNAIWLGEKLPLDTSILLLREEDSDHTRTVEGPKVGMEAPKVVQQRKVPEGRPIVVGGPKVAHKASDYP